MTKTAHTELAETIRQLDVLFVRTTQGSWRTYQNGVHPVEVGGMGSGDDYAILTHGPKSFANADWIATMHDEWPRIRTILAAAPDLLDACDFALSILEALGSGSGDAANACRAAIAKAEAA